MFMRQFAPVQFSCVDQFDNAGTSGVQWPPLKIRDENKHGIDQTTIPQERTQGSLHDRPRPRQDIRPLCRPSPQWASAHASLFVDGTGVEVAGRQFKGAQVGYNGQRQYWLHLVVVGGWKSCPDGPRTMATTRLPSSPVELFKLALRVANGLQTDAINEAEQSSCPLSIVLVLLVRSKDEPSDRSGLPAVAIVDAIPLVR